jgi:hypothetical protein
MRRLRILDVRMDASDAGALSPDGVSMLQVMDGKPKSHTYSETLIRENHKVCLRSARAKLIVDVAGGKRQLFDLMADPEESTDLSQRDPSLTGEMETELGRFVVTHQKQVEETNMDPRETAVVADRLRGFGYID